MLFQYCGGCSFTTKIHNFTSLGYLAWFLSCGVGLRSSQLVIGYSQDMSTTVTFLSCHTLCRGSQVSQLNRTIVCFLPLEACIAPSNIMKTSPQAGGIYSRSNSAPPGPVSKVCSVFSNRDLPSTSGRQPKATAITYNVL